MADVEASEYKHREILRCSVVKFGVFMVVSYRKMFYGALK
jgi:hypothetical protein